MPALKEPGSDVGWPRLPATPLEVTSPRHFNTQEVQLLSPQHASLPTNNSENLNQSDRNKEPMERSVNYSVLRVERNVSTISNGGREASKFTELFRSKGNPVFVWQ